MHIRIALVALIPFSSALYTPKGSACAVECGTKASNLTDSSDLVCQDTAYTDTSKGVLFKQCIQCLSSSTYFNGDVSYEGNSDQYWYLLHMKYAQQHCLVDLPQTAAAKACATQCSPMRTALDVSWVNNPAGTQSQYAFCSWNSSQYTVHAKDCANCLQKQEGGVILGNFADTTYNACKEQPLIQDGDMVTAARKLFNSATVGSSATASSTSTSTTSTLAAATSPAISQAQSQATGLSSGAAAGIGVGATVVIIVLAVGIFFLLRRRKRPLSKQQGFTTLPPYKQEIEMYPQANEIGVQEKVAHNVHEVEARGLQPQELDTSYR